MRWPVLAFAAALLALPALPGATAAETPVPTPVEVLVDASGDVAAGVAGSSQPNPSPRFGTLDLVAARVLETPSAFLVDLQVAAMEPAAEPPLAESGFYMVEFVQGDVQYAIQLGRVRSQETGVWAMLARYDPAEKAYFAVDYLPASADVATSTFHVEVTRELVVDSHGARPYPGTSLSQFRAQSQSFLEIFTSFAAFAGAPPPTLRDRMPDTGNGTFPVPVLFGPAQQGSARLSSPMPVRQSNGEATTFLFTVEARNVGDKEDRYRLAARSVPRGWNLTIDEDPFPIPAGGSVKLPVLVSVPFQHEHGTFQHFLLRLQSTADPASRADFELGVRYPLVPQPAGHHNVLHLHGAKWTDDPTVTIWATAFAFNTEYAWMNALENDPVDADIPVPSDGTFQLAPPVPGTFRWTVPLAPDLAIGLDFDTTARGEFVGAFQATAPILGAHVSGEVVLYVDSRFDDFGTRIGGNRTVLAKLEPTAAQDMSPGAPAAFTAVVAPTPASDLVPLQERSAMVLELNLTGMRPDTAQARDPPKLLPGAALTLPLLEYHDPVDASFAATPTLSLRVEGSQDRAVNPGKTLVFPMKVRLAEDSPPRTVQLRLAGDRAWARLLNEAERPMQPGEEWSVAVALEVPAHASTAHAVDFRLVASAKDDPALRSIVRLYATVTTAKDIPDEAPLAQELDATRAETSPAPVVALLLVLALGSATARRRSRPLAATP